MKNVFAAFIACFITVAAVAQSKIEKELQGTWKMAEMNINGVHANAVTKEIKFSKELESQLTPEKRAAFNENRQMFFDKITESRISFSDKHIDFVILGVEKQGAFTIKPQADAYLLIVDGNIKDAMIVAIKDGKLHIVNSDDAERAEFVFTKIVIK